MKKKWLLGILGGLATAACVVGFSACNNGGNPGGDGGQGGHEHKYTNYVSNGDATCQQDGTETAHCDESGCEETHTRTDEGSKLSHNHSVLLSTTPATCASNEVKTYKCETCNDTQQVETPNSKTSHNHTTLLSTAPATCTSNEIKTYKCATCTDTQQVEIPNSKTSHSHTVLLSTTPASCTSNEIKTYKCATCTDTQQVEIPNSKTSHSHTVLLSTTPATCMSNEVKTYKCATCVDTIQVEIPNSKVGHTYTQYIGEYAPATYTSNRIDTYKCANCTATENREIAGTMLVSSGIGFKTLTVDGTNVYGKVSNATTEFSFINEVEVEGIAVFTVDNDKDCGSPIKSKTVDLAVGDNVFYVLEEIGNNVKLYTVTIRRRPMYTVSFNAAGGTAVASQQVEEDAFATAPTNPTKTGYTFDGWSYDFTQPITGNTTITAEWTINQYTLTIVYGNGQADETITQDYGTAITVADPVREGYGFTGWDNIPATMPAQNRTVTAQWSAIYRLEEGMIKGLTDYGRSNYTTLNIPSEIDGTAITGIGDYAFQGCESLTSVVIPDGVTSIGDSAFYGCESLTSVVIPDGVTSIGDYAFYDCTNLTSIDIPDGVTSIGGGAFYYCDNLEYRIEGNCKYLGSRTNPYFLLISATSTDITTATINQNCWQIQSSAFRHCKKLQSIVIPDSVTSIGKESFLCCYGLTSVVFGDGLTSIGDYAFYGCESLTSVVIPDSVTSIGCRAFYDCTSLTSITFEDTSTWYVTNDYSGWKNKTGGTEKDLSDVSTNVTYFKSTDYSRWYKL